MSTQQFEANDIGTVPFTLPAVFVGEDQTVFVTPIHDETADPRSDTSFRLVSKMMPETLPLDKLMFEHRQGGHVITVNDAMPPEAIARVWHFANHGRPLADGKPHVVIATEGFFDRQMPRIRESLGSLAVA